MRIDITNCRINNNSQVLNRVKIYGNVEGEIKLRDTEITENARVLEDLEVGKVFDRLSDLITSIDKDSQEYAALLEILKMNKKNKNQVIEKFKEHILNFSNGVLVNIISNILLSKK